MDKATKSSLFSTCYDVYIYILLTIFYTTLMMSIFGDFYSIPIAIITGLIYLNHLRILRKSYKKDLTCIAKVTKGKTFFCSKKLSIYMYFYYGLTRVILPLCNFFILLVISNNIVKITFTAFVFFLCLHYNYSRELGMNYRANKEII